jgi:hypothetical protein
MARQRKPTVLHELECTTNTTRHRDRGREPKAAGNLGAPPNNWKAPGRSLWYELRKQIPEGVATASDRAAFELLVLLFGHVRAAPDDLSPALAAQLRCALGMFGLYPASRAALSVPPPRKSDDPASEFFDDL